MLLRRFARVSGILGAVVLTGLLLAGPAPAQETPRAEFLGGALRSHLGGLDLRLDLSAGVPWRVYTLTEPDRLVVDLRGLDWRDADPDALDLSDSVTALRLGSYRPGWSRLVAVLDAPMPLRAASLVMDAESGHGTLRVELARPDRATFDARAGAPPPGPDWDMPPVAGIRPEEDGAERLRVMIDPGHGGLDPGAGTGEAREADLMLHFARTLRDALLQHGAFEVEMTRDSDIFVSLGERVARAHAARADVLLSLHADSIDEGAARGASVYTLSREASDAASAALAARHDRGDLLAGVDLAGTDDRVAGVLMDLARLKTAPRSQALARHLVAALRGARYGLHKRPLREADFAVLRAADIPSVLIELGFVSSADDLRNLRDPAWRAEMAGAIRDALLSWTSDQSLTPR